MPDGSPPPGYHVIAEAFNGGVDFGLYVALAVVAVLIVGATVRRVLGTV